MDRWANILALSVGGALGVNARHYADKWITQWAGTSFPWGIFLINVSGSFAIGFLSMVLERWLPSTRMRYLVIVGFLGGYTTFSTYSMQTLLLWKRGEPWRSAAYFVGSAVAGLLAVILGVMVGRRLW